MPGIGIGEQVDIGGSGATTSNLVLPGAVLASQRYAPGTVQTYTLGTSTTPTALDATNLTLAFTVPASGIVDFEFEAFGEIATTAAAAQTYLKLLNHTGGAQIGETRRAGEQTVGAATTNVGFAIRQRWHLTGLTPGPLQIDIAAYAQAQGTSSVNTIVADNGTSATAIGTALLQAFASV